ncbi:MAG: DUF2029 domain-containing protein [Hyphomicrobiales bacterium]|nr:DUF2029 domain-containing protein [Hyphomicrobiales bacterium]
MDLRRALRRGEDIPADRAAPLILILVLSAAYGVVGAAACLWPTGTGLSNMGGGVVGNDFLAFYSAARLTITGNASAVFDMPRYFAMQDEISHLGPHFPWAYPPNLLLLIAPLGALPYLAALPAWLLATTTPFVLLLWRRGRIALPAILLAPPIVQNTLVGQNGALTASLLLGGCVALGARRSLLAGLLFGLLVYKPQVAVLAPIAMLAAGDRRALLGFVVSAAALPLASVAAFGLDIWWAFLVHLPDHMQLVVSGKLPADRFPTVFVLVERLTHDATLAKAAQAVSTLAAWVAVWTVWRRSRDLEARIVVLCVAMPLATPFMLEYDLTIWAAPGLLAAMRVWRGAPRRFDRVAMFLWLTTPPAIWIASLTGHVVGLAPVLAVAAGSLWVALTPSRSAEPTPVPA